MRRSRLYHSRRKLYVGSTFPDAFSKLLLRLLRLLLCPEPTVRQTRTLTVFCRGDPGTLARPSCRRRLVAVVVSIGTCRARSCESALPPGRASHYPEGAADPRARADELLRQVRVHSERRASEREQHGHGDEERAPGGVEPRPLKATWRGRGAGVGVGVGRAGRARASRGRVGRRAGARVLKASSSMSVPSQSCRASCG